MTERLSSPLLEQAMRVAGRAHAGQKRKATDLPYLSHPCSVALILARAGFAEEHVLAAALLHDVVEDTSLSLEELAEEFPPPVLDCVAALTEHKHNPDGTRRDWPTRKAEHLDQLAEASLEVRAVVLADKLHNLTAMLYDLQAGEELWSRFNASPREILGYHRAMIDRTARDDDRLQRLGNECRDHLQHLEGLAPSH